MNISLSGKTAVICGSTQGIGLAIAKELASIDCTCILLARDGKALKEAVEKLPAESKQQHKYYVADFTDPKQVKIVIEKVAAEQPVHVLVNNTGGPAAGPITEASAAAFEAAFQQHLVNNHILAHALIQGMKKAQYGRIINIISTSVRIPLNNLGVSNTVRAAVASWAKTLSNEVAQFNITVNNVLPGYTKTKRLDSLISGNAVMAGVSEEELSQKMVQDIPAKRFGEPQEVAAVAAFLASPAASYVNGVSIPVDGGRTGTI